MTALSLRNPGYVKAAWIATALALCCPSTGRAQTLPGQDRIPALSLTEILAYTRAHQPELRRAQAQVMVRQREARIPRAAWLPQLGATAQILLGTTNNTTASPLSVDTVDLPRIGGTRSVASGDWTPSPSTLAAIGVNQELFDFGRIAAQAATADALIEVARASAQGTLLDLLLRAEEAYDAVLAARQILGAAQEAQRRAQTHFNYADAGVHSGMRPPIDRTRAQAEVARNLVLKTRAEGGLQAARAALAAAIGADTLEVDVIEPTAESPPAPAFREALRLAAERSPAVLSALAQIRAQRAATVAIGKELLPDVALSGTLSGRAGGAPPSSGDPAHYDGLLPSVANWHIAAVLKWNLFDATVFARRSASRAQEQVARAGLDLARMDATLQVERAYVDLLAAQRIIPDLIQSLTAAQANQAQAAARFQAGLGTILDLADAEALLINGQLDLAIGRFQAARARAQLGRAIGEAADTLSSNSPPQAGPRP